MSRGFNRIRSSFGKSAGYELRWPRPLTAGPGHGRSRRRRPWGTCSRVRAHGRYTIRRGYASVSFGARGSPSRAPAEGFFLARGSPSHSPAEGSEHAHAGKILRDHRGPWCNIRASAAKHVALAGAVFCPRPSPLFRPVPAPVIPSILPRMRQVRRAASLSPFGEGSAA